MYAQLCFFFYTTMVLLALQMLFIIWRCKSLLVFFGQWMWQALWRKTHCVWCWQALHIKSWWPEQWTSTICYHHRCVMARHHASYRAAKAAIQPTAYVAPLPPASLMSGECVELAEVL